MDQRLFSAHPVVRVPALVDVDTCRGYEAVQSPSQISVSIGQALLGDKSAEDVQLLYETVRAGCSYVLYYQ